MAFPASTSGNLMLFLKVALISTGALSIAAILKLWVPVVTDFAIPELPVIYSSVLSWLRPPYLYLVINCIIISIVASSKLQLQKPDHQPLSSQPVMIVPTPTPPVILASAEDKVSGDASTEYLTNGVAADDGGSVGSDGVYGRATELSKDLEEMMIDGSDKLVVSSVEAPQRSDSVEFLIEKLEEKENEKPLVSARFGHRKSVKASPEGGKASALGVSKPKRLETLESTWRTITEGRAMPLTRHLKKSDTWDSHVGRDTTNTTTSSPPPPTKMKKSETFSRNNVSKQKQKQKQQQQSESERSSLQGSGKVRREPSLNQEELNRQVEAFINKFNEEMRLQRQESLNQYQEMINRGAY